MRPDCIGKLSQNKPKCLYWLTFLFSFYVVVLRHFSDVGDACNTDMQLFDLHFRLYGLPVFQNGIGWQKVLMSSLTSYFTFFPSSNSTRSFFPAITGDFLFQPVKYVFLRLKHIFLRLKYIFLRLKHIFHGLKYKLSPMENFIFNGLNAEE